MHYAGCFEHSQNNTCTIAFTTTTTEAENKEEIEFTVIEPITDHFVAPSVDEATSTYTKRTTPT